MRIVEDLICGALGYGIGKRVTNQDVEKIIDSYLQNVRYDDLISDYKKFHPTFSVNEISDCYFDNDTGRELYYKPGKSIF